MALCCGVLILVARVGLAALRIAALIVMLVVVTIWVLERDPDYSLYI